MNDATPVSAAPAPVTDSEPSVLRARVADLESENARLQAVANAAARLFALPNWAERCGPFKDVTDALHTIRAALPQR